MLSKAKAAKAAGALRSGAETRRQGNVMRSVDKAVARGFAHRLARREIDTPEVASNSTDNKQQASTMPHINFTTFNVTNVTSI
ncbi:uncharacterized protein LOC113501905 isoform X2 [Trichoplusia ni]|uniref:Uncharacterized protein LOC113501905 isoform X2 n=1 Tax=Trichoplusia ni TaxID=7111 RepID=A0A7E5WE81_TRINI|nr:uncharacterized protein LOC113501905 isoform X2 [Trichoplusia ni]